MEIIFIIWGLLLQLEYGYHQSIPHSRLLCQLGCLGNCCCCCSVTPKGPWEVAVLADMLLLCCWLCLQESIRGCDVFLVQPTCPPVNDSLMELLVTIDACRRASARTITAVLPYYGYARADRKTQVSSRGECCLGAVRVKVIAA